MYWWGIAQVQPWVAIGIALVCAVIIVALFFAITYGISVVLLHDFSIRAFWNGMKMGFIAGLQFQWDFVLIVFALIITCGAISSFTSK